MITITLSAVYGADYTELQHLSAVRGLALLWLRRCERESDRFYRIEDFLRRVEGQIKACGVFDTRNLANAPKELFERYLHFVSHYWCELAALRD
ncbi:hypothetical protein H6758_00840 [Candidatus Nomurabacteria bacterium]|nr:hypothetical protein [Candidatus Nomurabacteria bacterium]